MGSKMAITLKRVSSMELYLLKPLAQTIDMDTKFTEEQEMIYRAFSAVQKLREYLEEEKK